MKGRFMLAALVALLMLCAPALAAPATVQLRVEGASSTIFEGPVTTDGKTITKGPDTLACDGTTATPPQGPGPTMTSALDDGLASAGLSWEASFFNDFFISGINGEANDFAGNRFWGYALNGVAVSVGGCQQTVQPGDEVLYAFDFFTPTPPDFPAKPLLKLAGPGRVATGAQAEVAVRDNTTGAAFAGATVGGQQTDAAGKTKLGFPAPGLVSLKAEAPGAVRSNALKICVSADGNGDCGVPPEQLGTPRTSGGVRDSKAPIARISGLQDGKHYTRGPRLLKGTARDDGTGVSIVKLALRRHVSGHCTWWSGRRERFVGTNCRKKFFFGIGSDANWSYQLARSLPPGRYVLDVKAFDRVRNRDEKFVRGQNRIVFYVDAKKAGRATAARSRGVRVKVMVVGRDGDVLAKARSVRAASARVRASGRRCKVNASTPLAALVKAGLPLHVRDYGRCSRRSGRDSGQLFVDRIDDDRNSGQDGWVYKVGPRAGSAGAADPAGPFGSGALPRNAEVLWFYCLHTDAAGGCQRSLSVSFPTKNARAGQTLAVTVRGYDNEGRGQPAAGARVTLGPVSAQTGAHGRATFTLPPAGSYVVQATANGKVPSFPVALTVV
jgi:Domain of unknown function (DUF4430)